MLRAILAAITNPLFVKVAFHVQCQCTKFLVSEVNILCAALWLA